MKKKINQRRVTLVAMGIKDVKDVWRSGKSRVKASIKHSIAPRIINATPFLPKVRNLDYWRDHAHRSALEERIKPYLDHSSESIWDLDCKFQSIARTLLSETLRGVIVTNRRLSKLPDKISPLSMRCAQSRLVQNKSPGFPFSKMGFRTKKEVLPHFNKYIRSVHQRIQRAPKQQVGDLPLFQPCLSYSRCALHEKPKNKPRLVWGYPMEASLFEAMFSEPLMDILYYCDLFAWKINWLGGYSNHFYRKMDRGFGAKFGFDFKSFDQTPSAATISYWFDFLGSLFKMTSKEKKIFAAVKNYFINTPMYFYGDIVMKDFGIPSGSNFTQLLGSIINLFFTITVVSKMYVLRCKKIPKDINDLFHYLTVLGDDSSANLRFPLLVSDRELMVSYFNDLVGATIHPTKGWFYAATKCNVVYTYTFLGKNVQNSEDVKIDTKKLQASIWIPEDKDKQPGDVLTRLIGLKWMVGTTTEAYDIINNVHKYMTVKYPELVPTPWKSKQKDYFKYLFGVEAPSLSFPSDYEVMSRYQCYPAKELTYYQFISRQELLDGD